MTGWALLPVEQIPTDRLTWPCHDINPDHLHPTAVEVTTGPIRVEQLADGSMFVHDGRHRAVRAIQAGAVSIAARVIRHR